MKIASILVAAAGVGLAGYALNAHFGSGEPAPEAEVATLPQRAIEPAVRTPAVEPQKATATPGDRASLTRELQRELQRVGCYSGEITGVWTTSSRMAMKTFTDRVNATLPIDQPDYILLSLVQRHQGKACGTNCPSGQSLTDDNRCVPSAVVAKAIKAPEPKPADRPDRADKPDTTASWSPTAGLAPELRSPPIRGNSAIAPKIEPAPSAAQETTRMAAAKGDEDRPPDPAVRETRPPKRFTRQDGPVPEVGIYEDPAKRRYSKSKPPKLVKKFLRNMQRALAGGW